MTPRPQVARTEDVLIDGGRPGAWNGARGLFRSAAGHARGPLGCALQVGRCPPGPPDEALLRPTGRASWTVKATRTSERAHNGGAASLSLTRLGPRHKTVHAVN